MSTTTKTLVPNKCWIIEDNGIKLGTLNKENKGYSFFRKGTKIEIKDLGAVKRYLGVTSLDEETKKSIRDVHRPIDLSHSVYGFPCSTEPYNPVYNIIKRLPIYAKSSKSKSLYCAGHYVIQFNKGWVKGFCPKLITLERNPYQGPFKTKDEALTILKTVSKQ